MPLSLPLDVEANGSRLQALGVKRSLVTSQGDEQSASSLPQSQQPLKAPRLQQRRRGAKRFGEKYGLESQEYKFQLLARRRRKNWQKKRQRAGLPALPHFSESAEVQEAYDRAMSALPTQDRAGPLAWNQGNTGTIRTSLRGKLVPASNPQIGNNRLATGFASGSAAAAPSPDSLESGETHSSPIEISSDEEESEGGMQLNIKDQATLEVIDLDSDEYEDEDEDDDDDDDDDKMEDGEEDERAIAPTTLSSPVAGDPDAHMQLQGELERHLSTDFQPLSIDAVVSKQPAVRLADLPDDQLEIQLKYCFYGLLRNQIDLSRLVICLECLQEGHTHVYCPERYCLSCNHGHSHLSRDCPRHRRCTKCRERGHDATLCQLKLKQAVICEHCGSTHHIETECTLRFFPSAKPVNDATIKLWISCCNCASKTHLVGDCTALRPDKAPRWSLRTLDAQQITNLSLQTGISGLEKAAENRNMRPQGRNIRPARQRPTANQNQRKTFNDDDSEDTQDSFIHPPVSRQNQRGNISFAQQGDRFQYPRRPSPEPYDRYDAPTAPNNRSRGDYYQTDSFGQRRRSRSPDSPHRDAGDTYRPHEQGPARRSLENRAQYPPGRGAGQGRNSNREPPLPAGPPPEDRYRPGAGNTKAARPAKSTYQQAYGQGQKRGRGGYFH